MRLGEVNKCRLVPRGMLAAMLTAFWAIKSS